MIWHAPPNSLFMLSADAEQPTPNNASTRSGADAPATVVRAGNKRPSPPSMRDDVDQSPRDPTGDGDLLLARAAFEAAVHALIYKHTAPDFGTARRPWYHTEICDGINCE